MENRYVFDLNSKFEVKDYLKCPARVAMKKIPLNVIAV